MNFYYIRYNKFFEVNFRKIDFSDLKFIKMKFMNSNLDLIGIRSIEIWKSKQSIEIEESSNLEPILKEMNLIISTD